MRVLVTGHRGYIGSVLTKVLANARFDVVGLDTDLYQGCDFGRISDDVPSFDTDIRDIEFADLVSFDAVVHLAALTNDSATLDAGLINEINHTATIRLAECCKKAGVSRFIFASSCSVYGRSARKIVDERSPVEPIGPYAQSKLRCEHDLLRLTGGAIAPVIMRNATVYGASPRLRMDIVVNDFVASAVARGRITMRTAGGAWRPFVHVEDLARVYAVILTAPDDMVSGQVFNVNPPDDNYRIANVADLVAEQIPPTTWTASDAVFDERSYRVDGSKLLATLPQFRYRWSLNVGIRQLRNALSGTGVTPGEWRSDRYRRSLRLQKLIEAGRLSPDLRQMETAAA